MTDVVERLRLNGSSRNIEAANEIELLRAQLATARKALEQHFALMRADRENGNDLLWTDAHEDLYHATDAALNSGEQKQPEDWPYPEGNPTCAQDLK